MLSDRYKKYMLLYLLIETTCLIVFVILEIFFSICYETKLKKAGLKKTIILLFQLIFHKKNDYKNVYSFGNR